MQSRLNAVQGIRSQRLRARKDAKCMEQVSVYPSPAVDAAPETSMADSLKLAAPFVFAGDQHILSGRPKGEEVRHQILAHLENAPDESVTSLDMAAVQFMDVSFADELFNKLLLRVRSGELGNRFVFVRGTNTSLRETIEAVLELRDLALLLQTDEEPKILGELKRPLHEALEVILTKKSATSAAMSEALGKKRQYRLQPS